VVGPEESTSEQLARELLVGALAVELDSAESGLAFVYRALDVLSDHFHLRDALVVVDLPPVGRQAFRADRRPLPAPGQGQGLSVLDAASALGIHTDPPLTNERDIRLASEVASLISVALRLDLLRHDSTHDALTGLFNRRSHEAMLAQAASRGERYGWSFAVLLLDLDRFKAVNDRFGHAAGDAALRAVGQEIRQLLRSGDVASRIGGDEFALLLPNGRPEMMEPLLSRLAEAVQAAVPGAGVRFSAGMACYPADADTLDGLLALADERLYAAKLR
jgi:diguanylate cyclase (GGDEF)-like protein